MANAWSRKRRRFKARHVVLMRRCGPSNERYSLTPRTPSPPPFAPRPSPCAGETPTPPDDTVARQQPVDCSLLSSSTSLPKD